MMTRQGRIAGLHYRFPEGIATMVMDDGRMVFVESGMGLRGLARCFGATEGKGDLFDKIKGQEILYTVDFMNVLVGFTPANELQGPAMPEEGRTE